MAEQSIKAGVACLVMDRKDNVATLLRDVVPGEEITFQVIGKNESVTVQQSIKFGHKIAIVPIAIGEHVIKYGESIGAATVAISIGEHVHVPNIEGIRGRGDRKPEKGGKQG
ncbi:MAG: UxaA family hydrolase [Bacillus sp. (in: firmicutes)]